MKFKVYNNPNPEERYKRKGFPLLRILLVLLLLLLIFGGVIVNLLTDYIWMDTLGFGKVFTTILWSKVLLGLAGFVIVAAVVFFTLWWIRGTYLHFFDSAQVPGLLYRRKWMLFITGMISVLAGLFGSGLTQGFGWERFLKFFNRTSFDVVDPIFGFDISFYVFTLPFIKFVIGFFLGLAFFMLLVELVAYSVFNIYRKSGRAQFHLGLTLGSIGLCLVLQHLLAPYETLLTNHVNLFQESVVQGLSYTDRVINIPKAYVMAAVAGLGTIWIIISMVRRHLRGIVLPVMIYIIVFLGGQLASVVVQNFIVSPNEFAKEKPYLQHNLDFTRLAYALNDIEIKDHPGNLTLTSSLLEEYSQTIDNVRINDAHPLLDVYNQLQTFRTYYEFNDVDVDRYRKDGEYQQVFISARELNTSQLPAQAQTWVNQKLRYTHGYGVAMSHVNRITGQGQPDFMVRNLPPQGEIPVERPQIYFGEEAYPNVIVNTKVNEFDYPSGGQNVDTRYEAKTGIPLQGLNRLLFAISEGSMRMFVSGQITPESQLLDTRNVTERLQRIAPIMEFDDDPYIVVRDDGSLVWIVDAYLTAERFPYSEPFRWGSNYIRNSVKAAVDAYTGEVRFYAVDPSDPLLQTYQKIFPTLFTEEVPEDIRAHFRYPLFLFETQAEMYATYHMTDLEVFYNREDFWQFPTEKYFNLDIEMEPYYTTMRLPGETEEEFVLMMPFTPRNRQNMIAWMGVRNDGDHYGEVLVYRFPKQKTVYGPQQIENRINQNSEISQQLNLWSQGGSEVIRGNLLVIPIEDTILYVEPIYIKSNNDTSLPEVKRIVVAYGDHIVMEPTFDAALDRILELIGETAPQEAETEPGDAAPGDPAAPILDAEQQLREVADLFDSYQEAIRQGNWEESGRIMQEIQERLEEVE